jgi:hypothetical protein
VKRPERLPWWHVTLAGAIIVVITTVASEMTKHEDDYRFAPLLRQSQNIARIGANPRNKFVCAYVLELEAVVEGYRDAQIATTRAAIQRDKNIRFALLTQKAMYAIAVADKKKLVRLRSFQCIDITKLQAPNVRNGHD